MDNFWKKWFAWYPIKDIYGDYGWLEVVWRRKVVIDVNDKSKDVWEYARIWDNK